MKKFEDMKDELAQLNGYAFWLDLIKGRTDKQISDLLERAGRMLDEYYTGEAIRQFGEKRETPVRYAKDKGATTWVPMHTPPPPDVFVVCIHEEKKLVGVDRKNSDRHFKAEWTHWCNLPAGSIDWDFLLPEGIERIKYHPIRTQWQRDEEQRQKDIQALETQPTDI